MRLVAKTQSPKPQKERVGTRTVHPCAGGSQGQLCGVTSGEWINAFQGRGGHSQYIFDETLLQCSTCTAKVPGCGLPSLMLKAVAKMPNGKAPMPKDIWNPPSPKPKPWNPCNGKKENFTVTLHWQGYNMTIQYVQKKKLDLTGVLRERWRNRSCCVVILKGSNKEPFSFTPQIELNRSQWKR